MSLALTILTWVPEERPLLHLRLPHLIDTLRATDFPGSVTVVDDHSTDLPHIAYLEGLEASGIFVVRRPKRGGIARAKNTCLRVLQGSKFSFGFIMEDDMEVSGQWWKRYTDAHRTTGIHHFSWASNNYFSTMKKVRKKVKRGFAVKCSRLNGSLLTVTPQQIRTLGGFKVLPHKWGYEHVNYTERCIRAKLAPFYADVVNSNNDARLGPFSKHTFIKHADRVKANKMNQRQARSRKIHEPIQE